MHEKWGREEASVWWMFAVLKEFWFGMSGFNKCSLLHVSYSSALKISMFIHARQWTISYILFL